MLFLKHISAQTVFLSVIKQLLAIHTVSTRARVQVVSCLGNYDTCDFSRFNSCAGAGCEGEIVLNDRAYCSVSTRARVQVVRESRIPRGLGRSVSTRARVQVVRKG